MDRPRALLDGPVALRAEVAASFENRRNKPKIPLNVEKCPRALLAGIS
jgi:hypothetical protein